MAERITRQLVAEQAIVHEESELRVPTPRIVRGVDRNFELPNRLYAAMAVLFFAAAGVMTFGFSAPGMVVPTGIIAIFIAMFFAVPTLWPRMKPENPQRATSWARFRQFGIMTPYGRMTAAAATVQVLILPVLILVWAVAFVAVAAVIV